MYLCTCESQSSGTLDRDTPMRNKQYCLTNFKFCFLDMLEFGTNNIQLFNIQLNIIQYSIFNRALRLVLSLASKVHKVPSPWYGWQ